MNLNLNLNSGELDLVNGRAQGGRFRHANDSTDTWEIYNVNIAWTITITTTSHPLQSHYFTVIVCKNSSPLIRCTSSKSGAKFANRGVNPSDISRSAPT